MILETDAYVRTKMLNAIMDDPEIIEYFKEKYVDEDIWKFCIEREPSLFKKMKHPSESLCLFACEVDGSNLRYIRNKFNYIRITDIMVLTAVKSNPKAILYVPKKFLNHNLKELAFEADPSLMAYFDDIREEYIRHIIQEKPYALKYIKYVSDDILCEAIKNRPDICTYLNSMTKKMLEVLKMYHPNFYNLYKNNNSTV